MVLQNGVIFGLGIISFLSLYVGFQLRENEDIKSQALSLLFFFTGVLFINMIMYALSVIVQNESALSYLQAPIINIGLLVIIWITIVGISLYFLIMVIEFLKWLFDESKTAFNRGQK